MAEYEAELKAKSTYPEYVVDFDEPADTRYNRMFEDFKTPLLEMENYWYKVIPEKYRAVIADNMD